MPALIGHRRASVSAVITGLTLTLLAASIYALLQGPITIAPQTAFDTIFRYDGGVDSPHRAILTEIRLPRLLLAMLVGAVLAVCGTAMQGLFRNALADPSLIGVTSGASAGAACMIVLGSPWSLLSSQLGLPLVTIGAALGGFISVVLVYRLATNDRGTAVATMLLAGIAIGAIAAALSNLFSYFADHDMLRRISLWQMGSLEGANWPRVLVMAVFAVLSAIVLPRQAQAFNALLLGESEARHLGIDVERLKRRTVIVVAAGVGAAVAVAGVIAFVGLAVPHMLRLLIGPDNRALIPASFLGGALLVVVADTLARQLVAPAELPTGIVTALIGAPVFFSLLLHERRRIAS